MADELKNKLVTTLTPLHDQGKTPTQAVEHILQALGGHYADIARISVLTAELIADVLNTVYRDTVSAQEMAELLMHMGYPKRDIALAIRTQFTALDAHAIGTLLQDVQGQPQKDKDKDDVRDALQHARFSLQECDLALNALYPS